jgi:hypothetical protein
MTTYTISKSITAPADRIWGLLTDGAGYPSWNTTVISLEGEISAGNKIKLISTVNPKRAFKLTVAEMQEPKRMVWSDGMPLGLFRGVRTFTLAPLPDGQTEFAMEEVYSGLLEPLISKSIPDMTESFEEFAESLKLAAEKDA